MKKKLFVDFKEMANYMIAELDALTFFETYSNIGIVAKYEEARQFIKSFLNLGCDLHSIDLEHPLSSDYVDEYIVSLDRNLNTKEYEVWCEPFMRDGEYLDDSSDIIYVSEKCSANVVSHCLSNNIFVVGVGIESNNNDYENRCDNHYDVICSCCKFKK